MGAKAAIVLDTRRKKQDDTYPVKLRVTFERKQQYYPTPYSLSKEAYDRAMYGQRQNDGEKKTGKGIRAFEEKAIAVIDKLSLFSWGAFEKQYYTNRAAKDTLNLAFAEYAASLRSEERIGTAYTYECAQSSLNKFRPGARFADVTPAFLHDYEKWMLAEGNGVTTVGIYLRNLRSLINKAIADGLLTKDVYPFGRHKYEIPTSQNIKKALTLSEIAAIYNHPLPEGSSTAMSRDYWFFIYLCNGINMKDMCLLTYNNIKGDVIEFVRAKSKRTKRKIEAIRVPLNEELNAIIERWGNHKEDSNSYIFPVLEKGLTPDRQRQLVQQKTHVVNENMKAIATALGINREVTTYFARHSFASILKRSGASTEFIGEALGHGNVKTTQNYLAGFEDEAKAETLKALTAFKTPKS